MSRDGSKTTFPTNGAVVAAAADGRAVALAGTPADLRCLSDADLATLSRKFAWLSSFADADPSSAFHVRLSDCRAELGRRGMDDLPSSRAGEVR